jgi:hypothetical protein
MSDLVMKEIAHWLRKHDAPIDFQLWAERYKNKEVLAACPKKGWLAWFLREMGIDYEKEEKDFYKAVGRIPRPLAISELLALEDIYLEALQSLIKEHWTVIQKVIRGTDAE